MSTPSAHPSRDLARALALANEFKEGDLLVGGSADQADARRRLAAATLAEMNTRWWSSRTA